MGLLKEAEEAGFLQCLDDIGIEKNAFLGQALKGAYKGIKWGTGKLRLTGSRAMPNQMGPFNPKKLGKGQFLQNGELRQKGLLNRNKFAIGSTAGVMGVGAGLNKLHANSNQGMNRVLRRPRSKQNYGSVQYGV